MQYGETPLHMAAKNGCNEAAKLLLSHGAFVEAKANVKHPFPFPCCFGSKLWKVLIYSLISCFKEHFAFMLCRME